MSSILNGSQIVWSYFLTARTKAFFVLYFGCVKIVGNKQSLLEVPKNTHCFDFLKFLENSTYLLYIY